MENLYITKAIDKAMLLSGAWGKEHADMHTDEVLDNLNDMMLASDNEKSFITLREAVRIIKEKEQHRIAVPCSIGDRLYSIIGEKISSYVVTGFRIDGEKVYMESRENMLFPEDKFGQYYFWSHELAEREFGKKRHERTSGEKI